VYRLKICCSSFPKLIVIKITDYRYVVKICSKFFSFVFIEFKIQPIKNGSFFNIAAIRTIL